MLILFAIVFEILTIHSYRRLSATINEPQHLTDGCVTWQLRDYLYAGLQERQPVAVPGHCIYVHRVDEPWWYNPQP